MTSSTLVINGVDLARIDSSVPSGHHNLQ